MVLCVTLCVCVCSSYIVYAYGVHKYVDGVPWDMLCPDVVMLLPKVIAHTRAHTHTLHLTYLERVKFKVDEKFLARLPFPSFCWRCSWSIGSPMSMTIKVPLCS